MRFEKEVAGLYPWIRNLARKYYSDPMDAEDLAHDTVCKMLCSRRLFESGKPLKPWCEAIMQNTYITSYNRRQKVQFVRGDVSWSAISEQRASDLLLFRESMERIDRCRMRSRCVDCALLYAQGYSYDEISSMLGIPAGTVRSRISSARAMLAEELGIKS